MNAHSPSPALSERLSPFAPISLAALNERAAMMERLDQKYIVPEACLAAALPVFANSFDVLEIDGKRSFSYRTHYFDSETRRAYHDHYQGRRKRCKVRIRHYEDAGLTFLEVKLKDLRDVTIKRRMRLAPGQTVLDDAGRAFVEQCRNSQYDSDFGLDLQEVLSMRYARVTLVAREGGERMTIDGGLTFWSGGQRTATAPGMFVLETKSARENGLADAVLRGQHVHPVRRVSKYCVGMAALGRLSRANRFLPALRRLGLRDAALGLA